MLVKCYPILIYLPRHSLFILILCLDFISGSTCLSCQVMSDDFTRWYNYLFDSMWSWFYLSMGWVQTINVLHMTPALVTMSGRGAGRARGEQSRPGGAQCENDGHTGETWGGATIRVVRGPLLTIKMDKVCLKQWHLDIIFKVLSCPVLFWYLTFKAPSMWYRKSVTICNLKTICHFQFSPSTKN